MPEETAADSSLNASLLCRSGARAGARFRLRDPVTRLGRAPDNDAVIDGPDAATVSLYHCEISREDDGFRVRDRNSTNGTYVDGVRIDDAPISPSAILRLGQLGPEFTLVLQDTPPEALDRTMEISAVPPAPSNPGKHDEMLSAAVDRARHMRAQGVAGETMTIMRDVFEQALRLGLRRHRTAAYVLLAALLLVCGLGIWRIEVLDREKRAIDGHIQELEAELQKAQGSDTDRLLSTLSDYQQRAQSLRQNFLYRIGPHEDDDFVTAELRAVLADFGAEVYSIPPDFIERVNHYIEKYRGPDRPIVEHALIDSATHMRTIRRILERERMPPDLAYIPIVEGALTSGAESAAGAAGPWQMTATTARAYGLQVEGEIDERHDLVKSTEASCRYLKDLILDFGAGSSVMLALAAYNSGAGKVKQAVTRTVRDPIQQRNFWYLYRTRALPLETREYVPKVFAAILIGRNRRHFGF